MANLKDTTITGNLNVTEKISASNITTTNNLNINGSATISGVCALGSSLKQNNSAGYYIKNTSGVDRECFHMNSENALHIGHGNYANSDGNTVLCGNQVRFESRTDMYANKGCYFEGMVNSGGKARMWSDSEGGQFQILSPNDVEWSMDAYNDNFRLYKIKDGTYYCPLYIDGDNDVQVNDLWADVTSGERHIGFIDNGAYGAFLYSQPNGNGTRIGLYDNFVAGSIWQVLDDGYMHHNVHNEFNSGITLPYNKYIYFGGNGYIYSSGGQALYIAASSERAYALYLGVWDSAWTLCPNNDTNLRLGSPSCRWGNIYSTNATISTSDRNLKKDIQPLTDKHLKFFTMLQPVSFKFIDGTSNRTHIGFISQDVEEAMNACGLSDLDFAGFCKDQKTERVEKIIEVEKEVPKEMVDETTGEKYIGTEIVVEEQTIEENVPVEGEYIYSLRYEEFIALVAQATQYALNKIETLEERMSKFEERLALLENVA